MNLAYRDIRHHLGRFLLTCVGLGLLLGVVLSMIGIYRGLVEDALALVRAPAADLWVVEEGGRGPFAEASRIPEDTHELVARLAGVSAAGPVTYQSVEASSGERRLRVFVVGYQPGLPGGPVALAEGRGIFRSRYEVVADRRAGLALGARLRLGRHAFTVVGLTDHAVASGGDAVVFLTLADAQQLQFESAPASARRDAVRGAATATVHTVNAVVARLGPHAAAEPIAAELRRWKHLAVMTQPQQEALLLTSVVEKARRQIGLFTGTLVVVSAVVIALIIYTMTMDKLKPIATLKLIGAPDRTIVGLIVQQAVAMGVLGFGLGALLIGVAKDFFPRRVLLEPADVLALAAVVVAVCLIASASGVRLALKVDPATALGG